MRRDRGFTLVELVVAIVLFGVLAGTLTVFLRPAMDSYLATRTRAELTAQAGQAMARMQADIRSVVPNSIRSPGATCFELPQQHRRPLPPGTRHRQRQRARLRAGGRLRGTARHHAGDQGVRRADAAVGAAGGG